MQNLQMRQGTIYESQTGGKSVLLIHHNPMNLQSLALFAEPGTGTTELRRMSTDELIAMRKSGEWIDRGDQPVPETIRTIDGLLSANLLTETETELLRGVRQELENTASIIYCTEHS